MSHQEVKVWKVKILEEKKKFSRTNKWRRYSYKTLTLVFLNSEMASLTKFLKFPFFRKIDDFSTKNDNSATMKMRDFEEMKLDKIDWLCFFNICFQSLNSPLESIGPLTFMLRTVIYGRYSNRPYSLLETIQFKLSPCTLEWTIYSQNDCWLSSGRQSTLPQESWVRTVHYYS